MNNDKITEKERWDQRAVSILKNDTLLAKSFGSDAIPLSLRQPYLYYEQTIEKLVHNRMNVLEIGSGTGLHTYKLVKTGASITATDISPNALKVLKKNIPIENSSFLNILIADMEALPFKDGNFDAVVCAGSLSYGDRKKVDSEIRRVIKPNGYFICVDTLNNNLIYRFYRYINYYRSNMTKMMYDNTPTIERLNSLNLFYTKINVKYFGSIAFVIPLLSRLLGEKLTFNTMNYFDRIIKVKKSAYKFVLIAKV